MNIAIIGKSKLNSILRRYFISEGFIPFVFDDVNDIKVFSGEKGKYVIVTGKNSFDAGCVIITEESVYESGLPANLKDIPQVHAITELDDPGKIRDGGFPVVFLLDFPEESSPRMTALSLDAAVKLKARKKDVVYLARFMRTSDDEIEALYKRARNSGVTFIKYNKISFEYNEDDDYLSVSADDGLGTINIDTRALVTAGRRTAGANLGKFTGLLKLKHSEEVLSASKKFFLFPYYTNRKGIYFIDPYSGELDENGLPESVKQIAAEIKSEMNALPKFNSSCAASMNISSIMMNRLPDSSGAHAEIDAGKCAFCYTCYRACPHSAMVPDFDNSVMKNLKNECCACGICVSVCPAKAVSITGEEDDGQVSVSGSLKILCCENSGKIAVNKLAYSMKSDFGQISISPVSCGGDISVERILLELESFEKVLVAVCMDGACRHFEGGRRARRQVERTRELLKASGIDEKRVEYVEVSQAMPEALKERIADMRL